jgi:polyisoprenoid-binding protein YceI
MHRVAHHVRIGAASAAALVLAIALSGASVAQSTEPSSAPGSPAAAIGSLDGTWTVDPSLGSFDYAAQDFSGSWVGYRVQEELVGLGGTFAVGRTPDVSGSIALAGATLTDAALTADLTTLQSDQSMRDGQLGRQGIETDEFPEATFVLTEPIELGELPAEGEDISVNAVGDLTLHGVTKSVEIPAQARLADGQIQVLGSITFPLSDFDIVAPNIGGFIISIADEGTLEFVVLFDPAA